MLGKNFASLGFCSDGGHGKWMLVFPSLTRGNVPREGNQGSKVGVNTKQTDYKKLITDKPKSLGAIDLSQ